MAVLADLERLFERVFDRTTARLFRAHPQAVQLERRVERAMERARVAQGGRVAVPARYRVRLHPSDLDAAADAAGSAEALAGRLADAALAFARAHDYHLATRPAVALVADPSVAPGVIEVDAVAGTVRPTPRPDAPAAVSTDEPAAPGLRVEASATAAPAPAPPSPPPHLVPDVPIVGARAATRPPAPAPGSPEAPRSGLASPAAGPVPWVAPSPPVPGHGTSMFDVARPPAAATPAAPASPQGAMAAPSAAGLDPAPSPAGPDPAPPVPPAARPPSIRDAAETLVFRRPAPAPTRAVLRVLPRDGNERTIEVDGTPLTLGRAADNGLVLADPRVSRHHARLQARRGTLVLTDLGSTNGSRVNGVRVDECALGSGDRVVVGDTVLVVEQLPG